MKVLALIEGPYSGAIGWDNLDREETVVLVCGGSGMSVVLGLVDQLVGTAIRRADAPTSSLTLEPEKTVEVVWAVRDQGS